MNANKFQIFNCDKLASKNEKKTEYKKKLNSNDYSQLEMLKKLKLSYDNCKLV